VREENADETQDEPNEEPERFITRHGNGISWNFINSGEVWDDGPWQRTILNPLRPNGKTLSKKLNAQWENIVPQRHVLF